MLETLKSLYDLSPSAAEAALANLALRGTDRDSYSSLGEVEQRLAAELWDAIGFAKPGENDAKFYDLLNAAFDEVSEFSNPERIKKDAGSRGDLWPSLYRVILPDFIEYQCRQMRLSPRVAVDAVQNPEAVDHLDPKSFGFPEDTPYSVS